MLRLTIVLLLIGVLAGCQTPGSVGPAPPLPAGVTFEGGDGSSAESAVTIRGAHELTGVDAEYAWLAQHFPGYRVRGQSVKQQGKKTYDVIEITTRKSAAKQVHFDISDFSGKF